MGFIKLSNPKTYKETSKQRWRRYKSAMQQFKHSDLYNYRKHFKTIHRN